MYKLININVEKNQVLDSASYNYSKSIGAFSETEKLFYDSFFDFTLHSSKPLTDSISFIESFKDIDDIQNWVQSMQESSPNEKELFQEIGELTQLGLNISFTFSQGRMQARFWEFLYERIRKIIISHKPHLNLPSRLHSIFACESYDDVVKYRDKHFMRGKIYKIDTNECVEFRADMAILDEVEVDSTYLEACEKIQRYWLQQESSSPIFEVLLKGKVKILGEEA